MDGRLQHVLVRKKYFPSHKSNLPSPLRCKVGLACTRKICPPQPPTVSSNDTKHLDDSSTQAVTAVIQAVTAADTMSTPPPSRITGDEDIEGVTLLPSDNNTVKVSQEPMDNVDKATETTS